MPWKHFHIQKKICWKWTIPCSSITGNLLVNTGLTPLTWTQERKGRPKLNLFEVVLYLKFKDLLGNKTDQDTQAERWFTPSSTTTSFYLSWKYSSPSSFSSFLPLEAQLIIIQLQMDACILQQQEAQNVLWTNPFQSLWTMLVIPGRQ